jgi:hypothetical protein
MADLGVAQGVSQEFVELLLMKQPVALLVYVHWCAIMHRTPRRWFMNGWDRRAADTAMSSMGPEWNALLEWPRSSFESDPPQYFVHCLKNSPAFPELAARMLASGTAVQETHTHDCNCDKTADQWPAVADLDLSARRQSPWTLGDLRGREIV